MKIIWWTPGIAPDIGGIERLSDIVVSELARRGVDVLVLAHTGDTDFSTHEHDGVPVVRIPSRRALATRDLALLAASKRRVFEVKDAFRPDVVNVHLSDPSVHLHLTTTTPATRTVVTVHNDFATRRNGEIDDTLFGRALAAADAVTGVTASVLTPALWEVARRDGQIVAVIPNGAVVGEDPGPPPPGPPVVLAVGRLVEAKGFDVAIRGFARSSSRAHGATLRIVGDGPAREGLAQLAAELGVEVTFTGAMAPAAVAEEYRRAAFVVMPSRYEGQPLVAIEAALAGRAVVGSRIPGIANVVIDGHTGLLVPVDDVDALAAALDSLCEDPARMARLGAAGRCRAVVEHSIERCVEQYLDVYQSVLHPRGAQ